MLRSLCMKIVAKIIKDLPWGILYETTREYYGKHKLKDYRYYI